VWYEGGFQKRKRKHNQKERPNQPVRKVSEHGLLILPWGKTLQRGGGRCGKHRQKKMGHHPPPIAKSTNPKRGGLWKEPRVAGKGPRGKSQGKKESVSAIFAKTKGRCSTTSKKARNIKERKNYRSQGSPYLRGERFLGQGVT